MEATERRVELLKILCRRRHETIKKLSLEFGVSERTIRRDIDVLSLTYPIYTQIGRYSGGVYILDNFTMDGMYMKDSQIELLQKIYNKLKDLGGIITPEEEKTLHTIILLYKEPKL